MVDSTRINWTPYEEYLNSAQYTDADVALMAGSSVDAVRLKRKRMSDPSKGYIGLDITYFDLETTGLTAIMGRVLCASFADSWGRVTTFKDGDYPKENAIDDSSLCVAIRDYLETKDIIVGHNSKGFDVPFLNARLMRWDLRPLHKDIKHLDTMYIAGWSNVRIGSRKLVNLQKFSRIESEKSEVDWDTWALAGLGDQEAFDYVVEHCERDVLVLREVFGKVKSHIVNIHR